MDTRNKTKRLITGPSCVMVTKNTFQYSIQEKIMLQFQIWAPHIYLTEVGEVGYFNTTAYSTHPDQNVIFDWHYS